MFVFVWLLISPQRSVKELEIKNVMCYTCVATGCYRDGMAKRSRHDDGGAVVIDARQ